ncbi:hypothetical protein AMR42_13565 [Limnothrix sp. PR1529]|nr:hypothetical protein BCR12_08720 [Limnothrix sp. P13C2]PIB08501.1 hypothetical protein AMR42_13565 [Limnothrix sp. PR1529]
MQLVLEAAEEMRVEAQRLPSTDLEALPRKIEQLDDLCAEGLKTYRKAQDLVEEMRDVAGR